MKYIDLYNIMNYDYTASDIPDKQPMSPNQNLYNAQLPVVQWSINYTTQGSGSHTKDIEAALHDSKFADQNYTVKVGIQTRTHPVVRDIMITTYTKVLAAQSTCNPTLI